MKYISGIAEGRTVNFKISEIATVCGVMSSPLLCRLKNLAGWRKKLLSICRKNSSLIHSIFDWQITRIYLLPRPLLPPTHTHTLPSESIGPPPSKTPAHILGPPQNTVCSLFALFGIKIFDKTCYFLPKLTFLPPKYVNFLPNL